MDDGNKMKFAEIFTGACFSFGKDVSKEAMRLYWINLQHYSIEQVDKAFQQHLRVGKFFPSISNLIDLLEQPRPGADEAWAMIPMDEESSVVWTEEMAKAFAVASPLIHDGDRIAARMAFKDCYNRLCEQAKMNGESIRWQLSRGWDKESLGHVLTEAVRLGRLTQEEANPHLLEIEYKAPLVAGLIEGSRSAPDQVKAKQAVAALKAMLSPKKPNYDLDEIKRECEERDRKRNETGY